MERGHHLHSSLVHQVIMGGSLNGWWNNNENSNSNNFIRSHDHPSHDQQNFPLVSSNYSSSSNSSTKSSTFLNPNLLHDHAQDPPVLSWSQLLLGGCGDEEAFQDNKVENWRDQILCQSTKSASMSDLKHVTNEAGYVGGHGRGEILDPRASWTQILQCSSPRSCITTSSNSGMLDFSNSKSSLQTDHSSECNSTESGSASKKAKLQASSSAQSPFKVRKEKLGDRIAALHQLVSPFGKTDTASVLQESIGYIRFLHSQIEALSSPYMASTGSPSSTQHVQGQGGIIYAEDLQQDVLHGKPKKDLRSRGLCLVPVSCTSHVWSTNGADYWASAIGGGFR